MSFGPESPIIIKKKKNGHGGHHGGAWKVAYADFVTAMMALFIVLWVLGQGEEVQKAVAGYFKDPIGFSSGKGKGVIELKGTSAIDLDLKAKIEQKELEKQKLQKMGEEIINELSSSPEFQGLLDQIKVDIVDEGLRIEILESSSDVFFEIGSSTLNSKALSILEKIGAQLATLKNRIIVEGHTDSRPFQGDVMGYTNFELSADRANTARRSLTMGGLKQEQIEKITGYADRHLRNASNPYDVLNRRISIIVKYSESDNG